MMTPEEELAKTKAKQKRRKRDQLCFIAGFIVALAFVGITYLSTI